MDSTTRTILETVDRLADPRELESLFQEQKFGTPLPSQELLQEVVDNFRSIVFPGFYGRSEMNTDTLRYHIGVRVERLYKLLCKQISEEVAMATVRLLPELKALLLTDVEAAYAGDPAAETKSEVIACYPCIKALTNYRLAHELHKMGVPLIPRMLTEMAHSETGIDIHPGATIGHHFCIDHGTGVVIGSTCIIGNNVKLYQGVTLGAKSFPLDSDGHPIKGIPRHPILEDNVIVYSNATILGRITISEGSVIGANKWVTDSKISNACQD